MSIYPNEAQCIEYLEEANCKRRVLVHCCTVRTLAGAIAEGIDCDMDLVVAGAMLHDIGRAVDHSINHAVIGYGIAKELGLPDEIAQIIKRHTGAGLDEIDAEEFGLPKDDYIPRTIEQKIVAHADNMVSDNRLVAHFHSVEKLKMKGSFRGAERIENLHIELSDLYGSDLDILVNDMGPYPEMTGVCAEFTVPPECRL